MLVLKKDGCQTGVHPAAIDRPALRTDDHGDLLPQRTCKVEVSDQRRHFSKFKSFRKIHFTPIAMSQVNVCKKPTYLLSFLEISSSSCMGWSISRSMTLLACLTAVFPVEMYSKTTKLSPWSSTPTQIASLFDKVRTWAGSKLCVTEVAGVIVPPPLSKSLPTCLFFLAGFPKF